jgi:hypothetical protein
VPLGMGAVQLVVSWSYQMGVWDTWVGSTLELQVAIIARLRLIGLVNQLDEESSRYTFSCIGRSQVNGLASER